MYGDTAKEKERKTRRKKYISEKRKFDFNITLQLDGFTFSVSTVETSLGISLYKRNDI